MHDKAMMRLVYVGFQNPGLSSRPNMSRNNPCALSKKHATEEFQQSFKLFQSVVEKVAGSPQSCSAGQSRIFIPSACYLDSRVERQRANMQDPWSTALCTLCLLVIFPQSLTFAPPSAVLCNFGANCPSGRHSFPEVGQRGGLTHLTERSKMRQPLLLLHAEDGGSSAEGGEKQERKKPSVRRLFTWFIMLSPMIVRLRYEYRLNAYLTKDVCIWKSGLCHVCIRSIAVTEGRHTCYLHHTIPQSQFGILTRLMALF